MNKIAMLVGAIIFMMSSAFIYSYDGKTGATGSPGESNCSDCHSGTVNTGGGFVKFTSNIPNGVYFPGQTYEITITVEKKGEKVFGLDVEALLNKNKKNAGTFVITNKAETQLLIANDNDVERNNVTHQANGGMTNDSKSFKFNWIAPATDAGNLTFYIAGLAGNGDASPSGDYTYTITQLIKSANAGDNESNKSEEKETTYIKEIFGATRVVNGQSVEVPEKGDLQFTVSHHFGKVNLGPYEFFGLDQGTIRLGLEYGVTNSLSIAFGRSAFEKTFDGGIKYKFWRESTGEKNMPVTLDVYLGAALNSLKWTNTNQKNYFSSRLSYVTQILIARKFGENFSLQLAPTMVHKNLVVSFFEPNDVYAIGAGARYKLNRRLALSGEYYYVLPFQLDKTFKNEVSLGFDIQTARHIFQLHFTNAQPMFERAFITETKGQVNKGDIFFGFNISRTFSIAK